MLLVTALVGVLLAIREPAVRKYGSQRTAAEKLRAVGARITVEPIRPAPLRWLVANGDLGPITAVRLEGCQQPGDSLAALADLPDLERLYLPNSAVTDDHLQHVAGLAGIRRLALWRTQITERGFRHLECLDNLELLDVHGSRVSEDALPHLARLPHLRQIITTMTFTDHGLACLRTFAHHPRILRGKVVVEGVTNRGMADLGALTSIQELDIRNSNVSAEGYAQLVRLRLLAGLNVSGATCDDASLAQIRRIASLRSLDVHSSPAQVSLGGIMRCWGEQISGMRMLLTPGRRSVEFWGREGISASVRFAASDLGTLALCRNCEFMILRTDKLDDEILAGIGRMTNLTTLGLLYSDGKHWEGPVPGARPDLTNASNHLAALTRLKHLLLRCWSLDDDQLGFLNHLPALEQLTLFQLPISGAGFGQVRENCRLRRVDIGMCTEFDDDGLAELLRLKSVKWVNLVETGVKTHPSRATIKR
jgi:hypothetical protein